MEGVYVNLAWFAQFKAEDTNPEEPMDVVVLHPNSILMADTEGPAYPTYIWFLFQITVVGKVRPQEVTLRWSGASGSTFTPLRVAYDASSPVSSPLTQRILIEVPGSYEMAVMVEEELLSVSPIKLGAPI